MPYLTPQELPEESVCRSLLIPDDSEWLALFGGALTELQLKYNWEDSGGLTVDETISKMMQIINNWYTEPCASCTLPGGGRIIRIGEHGHIEELGDDGSWSDPTGDYVIPPPEAREGGTELDQNCLAAKNAVNVLQQLYETLSEQWAAHVSEAEAATEFTLALIAIVGFEFAPITAGIVAFFGVVFASLYTALEYLGADLWTEDFTDQMVCFLLTCVNNDDGVVTFDYDCFMGQLNSLTDSFGLSELQLRLYLQVSYILYFIGGIDGLNLAGGTTEITNDDCAFCGWRACIDLTVGMEVFEFISGSGGEWDGGIKPTVVYVGGDLSRPRKQAYFQIPTLDSCNVTRITQFYERECGDTVGSFAYNGFWHNGFASALSVTLSCNDGPYGWSGAATITDLQSVISSGGSDGGSTNLGDATLTRIEIRGTDDPPSQLVPYLC